MKGLVIELTLIAIGAVAGAFLRYRITSSPLLLLDALPVSVLIVNVTGSFIRGVFSVLAVAWNLDSKYSLLVAVGFCGSLTTMSSFALETVRLLDERLFGKMALNLIVNVDFSIGAIIAGRQLVNALMILRGGGGLLWCLIGVMIEEWMWADAIITKVKMWCLTIRINKNDQLQGKRLYNVLLDFMTGAGISGATVINGVDGFGRRGKSTLRLEGISVNYPLVIEVVDEQSKLDPLLPQIKRMVGDNGLVTIQEVYAL